MSNVVGLEPQYPSANFWLAYCHWFNAVNRWEGYMDEYEQCDRDSDGERVVVLEQLMIEETGYAMFWEHITQTYWMLWRN